MRSPSLQSNRRPGRLLIDSMLLAVDALTVERGGRVVLSDLSFSLAAGDVLLVTGRNGAGKSTLLRTLAGLLPMQSGRIVFADASDELRGVETIHYLGYEDALKPSLTVSENLAFWAAMLAGETSPTPPGRETMRFMAADLSPHAALAAFGIGRLLDLPAAYLSAGQKRRVALARLLLTPRPIWLLDEPLIALDVGAQQTLTTIMADHVARGGAIIAASHAPLGLPCRSIDLGGLA